MENIMLALTFLLTAGALLVFLLNSYYTFRLKSNYLRPLVKSALQYALQASFDYFAEKICVKTEDFTKAFTQKFSELAAKGKSRTLIEQVEVLPQPDQQLLITVKAPGLLLQDVNYTYATITGSKTVWSIASELGLLEFYLQEKAAARKRKLEQDKEVYLQIKTRLEKILKDLPIFHHHGIRQHNWDEILTSLYNLGEEELYDLVKANYQLLVSYETTVA